MAYYQPLSRLVAQFSKLPGVGAKTAQRYAYKLINMSEEEVEEFAKALIETKKSVHYCKICGNYTDQDVCDICKTRDNSIICVVKEPKDIVAFEKIKDYRGVYHVLQGTLNPMQGYRCRRYKNKRTDVKTCRRKRSYYGYKPRH